MTWASSNILLGVLNMLICFLSLLFLSDLQYGENEDNQELYAVPMLLDSYFKDLNFVNRSKIFRG